MEQDRNLLFGVLAVQLGKVSSSQLMRAAGAWAIEPTQPLEAVLKGHGAISEPDCELVHRLVEEAIRAHSGDARATLDTFGGEQRAVQTFGGTIRVTESGVKPAEPAAPAPPPPLGDTGVEEVQGRYQMVSEQGRGGYGRVLLVHDQVMARDIAMKELIPPSDDPIASTAPTPSREAVEAVARFLQEARITGQLEHPSIVPVYELGHRPDGSLYYTMKLVRGQTLSKEIAKRPSFRERIELLPRYLDLCHAMAYAHDRGVIHRDIKPDNVMVGSFGETMVIDWGLAKLKGRADVYAAELKETVRILESDTTSPTSKTLYGTILGTPHYMAPEQARGDIESIDERSDVYALGGVLYFLLTGKRPYDGAPLQNVILHRNLPELAPVWKLAPEAPPELVTICGKALEARQADRYQNAAELAQEIQRFLSGALVQSHQYTLRDQLRRFVRRYKAQVATAALAAASLLVVAVVSYVQILQANAREREQRIAAQNAEQVAVEKGRTEAEARAAAEYELYISNIRLAHQSIEENQFTAARTLLAACPAAYRNFEWGMLLRRCNDDLATWSGHEAPVLRVAAAPDGTWVASADAAGILSTWDAATCAPWQRVSAVEGPVLALAVSGDGRYIAAAGRSPDLVVRDVGTLEPAFTLKGHKSAINAVAFSPDGRLLASASSDDTARIWDLATQSEHALLAEHLNDVVALAWTPDQSFLVTAGLDDVAIVWDATTWKPVRRLAGHKNDLTCVAVSPDAKRIATGGDDGAVSLWDAATGQATASWNPGMDVNDLAFTSDGSRLAIAGSGPVVYIADLRAEGLPLFPLRGHTGAVHALAFLAKEDVLVTGGADKSVKQWYVPMELAGPPAAAGSITAQELHLADRDRKLMAFASTLGACSIYDTGKDAVAATITTLGQTGLGGRLWAFSPDASYLLFTGDDNRPKVFTLATGALQELQLADAPFFPGVSADGARIAISCTSGAIELFDAKTGARVQTVTTGQPGNHLLPVFSPDGALMLVLAMDEQQSDLVLADIASGATRWKATYDGGIADAFFTGDGQQIFVGGEAGLRAYSVIDGKEVYTPMHGAPRHLTAIAQTPDRMRLVVEIHGKMFALFDTTTGRELLRFDRPVISDAAAPLGHGALYFDTDGSTLCFNAPDCQGLNTFGAFSTIPWRESGLPGESGAALQDRVEQYKRAQRGNRLETARHRDRAAAWLARETVTSRERFAADPTAQAAQDPFAHAKEQILDVSPSQWSMLLQMGRSRLKQLRDVHGYRGMDISSDLVVDKSLADFLGRLGFENNDIIVRINDSSTPGYDMFIEALEAAHRSDTSEISVYFFRSGTPMVFKYVRGEPKVQPGETPPAAQ